MNSSESCFAAFTFVVIEDDAVFRHQLTQFLQQRGGLVGQAENGEDGLKLINDLVPDLILCDLRMPIMDGQQVIKALLSLPRKTPIIVISGAADMAEITQALENGAKDYFIKPLQKWSSLEQTILTELKPATSVFDQHSYALGLEQELKLHMAHFRHNDQAATQLLKELSSETEFRHGDLRFLVEGQNDFMAVIYYELSQRDLSLFIIGIDPLEPDAAVGLAMLKTMLNDNYRHYLSDHLYRLNSPSQMLTFLNQKCLEMPLQFPIQLIQLQFTRASTHLIYSNAGIATQYSGTQGGEILHCDLRLGLLPNYAYQEHDLPLLLPLKLHFKTTLIEGATDGITLTISDNQA